jgi:hypothetical protein
MSEHATDPPQVRVRERIEARHGDSVVIVDGGVWDIAFICDMLGPAVYMQAYAAGHLEMIHERVD